MFANGTLGACLQLVGGSLCCYNWWRELKIYLWYWCCYWFASGIAIGIASGLASKNVGNWRVIGRWVAVLLLQLAESPN